MQKQYRREGGKDNTGIREDVLRSRVIRKTLTEKSVLRYVFIVLR